MSNNNNLLKIGRIQEQSRKILLNVHNFMTKEAEELEGCIFNPDRFKTVIARTARATNISYCTVKRIVHGKTVEDSNHADTFVEEIRHEGRRRTLERVYLNDYEYEDMRLKIYDLRRKEQVTLTALLNKLIEIEFPGGKSQLRQHVKELGFKVEKSGTCHNILTEKQKTRLLRIKYLKHIKRYRSGGRNIIYGNEMNVHLSSSNELIRSDELSKVISSQYSKKITILYAGNQYGFLSNALLMNVSVIGDEENSMNKKNYEMWLQEQLIPNLQHNTIFVVDSATYSRTLEDTAPKSNAPKKSMQDWLTSKNIQFDPTLFKPELYDIVKQHKHRHVKYSLDNIMESYGHKVLVLPPYVPSCNPMKHVSSIIDMYLENDYEFVMTISEMLNYIAERFDAFDREDWTEWHNNAVEYEDQYLAIEDLLDIQDQLPGNYYVESSTSGSSNGDNTNGSSATTSETESEPVQPSTSRP